MLVIKEHTTCQFKVNMQWDECGHVEMVLTNSYTYCTVIFKLSIKKLKQFFVYKITYT